MATTGRYYAGSNQPNYPRGAVHIPVQATIQSMDRMAKGLCDVLYHLGEMGWCLAPATTGTKGLVPLLRPIRTITTAFENARLASGGLNLFEAKENSMDVEFIHIEDGEVVHRRSYTSPGEIFKNQPATKAEEWVHAVETDKPRVAYAIYKDRKMVDICHIAFRGWQSAEWNNLPSFYRMELLCGL